MTDEEFAQIISLAQRRLIAAMADLRRLPAGQPARLTNQLVVNRLDPMFLAVHSAMPEPTGGVYFCLRNGVGS